MTQKSPAETAIQQVVDGHRYRRLTHDEIIWLKDITESFELPGFYGVQLQIVELEPGSLWIRDNDFQ